MYFWLKWFFEMKTQQTSFFSSYQTLYCTEALTNELGKIEIYVQNLVVILNQFKRRKKNNLIMLCAEKEMASHQVQKILRADKYWSRVKRALLSGAKVLRIYRSTHINAIEQKKWCFIRCKLQKMLRVDKYSGQSQAQSRRHIRCKGAGIKQSSIKVKGSSSPQNGMQGIKKGLKEDLYDPIHLPLLKL